MKSIKHLKKICLCVVLLCTGGVASAAQYTMKIGTATINDAQHEWMKRFAAQVEKDSGNRIKVDIFPASQLGSIPKTIEQVQFNSAQGWIGPAEFLSGVDSRFGVIGSPGIFRDVEHVTKVINDEKFSVVALKIGEKKGIEGLGMFISGPVSFVSSRPLNSLADFKGMKIRVTASAIQMEQIKEMGASAVPMSLGEVLPALQQGALDGVMGNAPVFANLHYYGVAKNQLLTDQSMYVSYVAVSRIWLDALPPDLRKVVEDDARKVSVGIYDFAKNEIERSLNEWRKGGGTITRLSSADQAALFKLLKPVGHKIASRKPSDLKFFDLMTEVADRY